jgi:hypothetical protein
MESIAGLALWANHQSLNLPKLRARNPASIACEEDRAIVFVEPRKHPSTEFVLRNFCFFLPSWKIIIVHGEDNETFMKHIASTLPSQVEFLSCRVSDLPNASYNTLFTHPNFWSVLPKWVLIAQTDTLLLQPAKEYLDSLIAKDIQYCGAPWNYLCHRCKKPLDEQCGHMIDQKRLVTLGPHMVGNGGLSFRNTRRMKEISSLYCLETAPCKNVMAKWGKLPMRSTMQGTTNEDVFFCSSLSPHELPSRLGALDFAIEQVAPVSWTGRVPSIGAHKPWMYLPKSLVESILNKVEY